MADEKLMGSLASGSLFHRVLRTIKVATPAAGAEFVVPVEGGRVWRPIAVRGLLTTGVAVANRIVNLVVTDGNDALMTLPNQGPQVASQVDAYTWAEGFVGPTGTIGAVGSAATGMPTLALPAGYTLRSSTLALDVADQWSSVTVFVEEALAQPQGVHEYRDAMLEAFLLWTSANAEVMQ